MMTTQMCPGCGRHCYLDEAKCERGIEFAKTGVLPERKPRAEGGHGDRHHSEQKMRYRALPQDSKLACCITEMADVIRQREEQAQEGPGALHGELFSCLREEEREMLLVYLEKVRHGWRRR